MEREVGGGIGMGNTCKPMAVSFQCMTKSTTIKNNNNFKKKTNVIRSLCPLSYDKNMYACAVILTNSDSLTQKKK